MGVHSQGAHPENMVRYSPSKLLGTGLIFANFDRLSHTCAPSASVGAKCGVHRVFTLVVAEVLGAPTKMQQLKWGGVMQIMRFVTCSK